MEEHYLGKLFPALNYKNFRYFFYGQIVSLIGTWMQNIGQDWLVLELTNSAFYLGLITAMQFLPTMLFSLLAGSIVDHFEKRKVLLFTQSIMAILALILALITYFEVVQIWHIIILALLLGIVRTVDMPARHAFFSELVEKEHLVSAITLNSSVFNFARIIGPGFAGIMIGYLGIGICFFLNAASFLAVIFGLSRIRIKNSVINTGPLRLKNLLVEIKEGVLFIWDNTRLRIIFILFSFISIFIINYSFYIPLLSKQVFGLEASGYGILMTTMGIGSFVGALAFSILGKKEPRIGIMLSASVLVSAFLITLGFMKYNPLLFIVLVFLGLASITYTASVNTTVQLAADQRLRGRVMSIFSLILGGFTPIGSMISGLMSENLGIARTVQINGMIGLVAAIITILFISKLKKKQVNTN